MVISGRFGQGNDRSTDNARTSDERNDTRFKYLSVCSEVLGNSFELLNNNFRRVKHDR